MVQLGMLLGPLLRLQQIIQIVRFGDFGHYIAHKGVAVIQHRLGPGNRHMVEFGAGFIVGWVGHHGGDFGR